MNFYALPNCGGFLLDVHSSSGTSPCARFSSCEEVRDFFGSQGIHEERLAQIETICTNLKPGFAYHEKMFLPESVIKSIETMIAEKHGPENANASAVAA